MKKLLVSLSVLTVSIGLFAQTADKSPFEKYGYKKQIMYTSSKGEFEEFHDEEDIVEIGSVLFDTKTDQSEGTIKENNKNGSESKYKGLSLEQAIGGGIGHEGVHATDKVEINKDLKAEIEGKTRADVEIKPNQVEQTIIDQYKR
ncbi:MAG: hypothetical protein FWF52_01760 [Candidatus Azobacteroides sp.]|nr:hypothetical protein [Candidatus Azobacteroides sp.]